MQIGIVKETVANESRVAASPSSIAQLIKLNFSVMVEPGAGVAASFSDVAYKESGAAIGPSAEVWLSDILFKVNPPSESEIGKIKPGATVIGFFWPAQNEGLMKRMGTRLSLLHETNGDTSFFATSM